MIPKPARTLAMANKGVERGLPKNDATDAQSNPKDPIPRPLAPDPICCIFVNNTIPDFSVLSNSNGNFSFSKK